MRQKVFTRVVIRFHDTLYDEPLYKLWYDKFDWLSLKRTHPTHGPTECGASAPISSKLVVTEKLYNFD